MNTIYHLQSTAVNTRLLTCTIEQHMEIHYRPLGHCQCKLNEGHTNLDQAVRQSRVPTTYLRASLTLSSIV